MTAIPPPSPTGPSAGPSAGPAAGPVAGGFHAVRRRVVDLARTSSARCPRG